LPLDRLDSAVQAIKQLGKKRDLFRAFKACPYSDYHEPDFELKQTKLAKPAAALYNQALPALINIAARLPQEEIAALSAA